MAHELMGKLAEDFAGESAHLIPILQRIQETDGYLSAEAVQQVSRWLKVSENEIFGVATFYAQFHFWKPGKHHIKTKSTGEADIDVNPSTFALIKSLFDKIVASGKRPFIDSGHKDDESMGYIKTLSWGGDDPITGGTRRHHPPRDPANPFDVGHRTPAVLLDYERHFGESGVGSGE